MNYDNTHHRYVLGTRIDASDCASGCAQVIDWAARQQSRYVCLASAQALLEAHGDLHYRRVMNSADLVMAGGRRLAWMLQRLGVDGVTRVCAQRLMDVTCAAAADAGLSVGFYGGDAERLNALIRVTLRHQPRLKVVYSCCSPAQRLSALQDEKLVRQINTSQVRILFVISGCPEQEKWMLDHKGRINAVMVGLGDITELCGDECQTSAFHRDGMCAGPAVDNPQQVHERPRLPSLPDDVVFTCLLASQLLGLRRFNGASLHDGTGSAR